jgi:hypothetical protein
MGKRWTSMFVAQIADAPIEQGPAIMARRSKTVMGASHG